MDRRLFAKLLKRIDRENINVLDVGGGNGGLLDIIKSIHPRVVKSQVVDIDRGARDIAEMNGHDFFLGRIEDFSSVDKFDYTQGAPFWALSVIVWLQKYGLVKTDPNGSIMKHTLYPFLSVLFALFDMVRGSLFKTSQMFIVLSNNKDR